MGGLIDDSVEVGREALEEAVEKAALSCARGPVQAATIHEIIETGCVAYELVPNRFTHRGQVWERKRGDLAWSSWEGLRKRLKAAGFTVRTVFVRNKQGTVVRKEYEVRWRTDPLTSEQVANQEGSPPF